LPDSGLSDEALRERIRDVKRDEEQISFERRMLHGKIDVVRSEILERIARRSGTERASDDPLHDLVARLSSALTHQGPPPIEEELERFGADADAGPVDAEGELPELAELEDAELAGLVRVLTEHERRTSARRQELHRELDQLRAEHVTRLQRRYADAAEE
jgi:hypothetical protein